MIDVSRSGDNILSKWWWTIDRPMLFAFLLMIAFGIFMAAAATPVVANRIGIDEFYFLKRHLLYIIPSLSIIFFVSALSSSNLKKFALLLFIFAVIMTLFTLFFGVEIKGAKRWLSFFGFSMQPSEFAKPAFAILTAWCFDEQTKNHDFRGYFLTGISLTLLAFLLALQPDMGMLFVTVAIWLGQLFLNGLPKIFIAIIIMICSGGFLLAYAVLPHFASRIDKFLTPGSSDLYQINRSLDAFSNGGFFGVGPGEGIIKRYVPDAHADFVFSVLGEEFGFFICAFLIILITFIVMHGMIKALKHNNLFSILASFGLLSQFGLQSFINIASSLHIIPTKGMTLPFISYGGSSMIAVSICVGMILSLSKRKTVSEELF